MSFAGLNRACEYVLDCEVEDEVDGERDVHSAEMWASIPESPTSNATSPRDEDIEATVMQNSREVAEGTDQEYRRYVMPLPSERTSRFYISHSLMATFEKWLVKRGYMGDGETVFGSDISSKMPLFIIVWIMSACVLIISRRWIWLISTCKLRQH
jgi:hypothetical protein